VRQSISLLVVGVRDGDVANNVPAPQSLALALLALGAAGALSRKRLTR
jgi:MYXO-CTERM domain-containing protein